MVTAVTFVRVLAVWVMVAVAVAEPLPRQASVTNRITSDPQEGRTLVHNAMKRLAVLLPALTFKLGVMFTMLLVTALASTKGLLVGALLLALGMGHFIAGRFAVPATGPAIATVALPPQPLHKVHVLPAPAAVSAWPAGHLHHHLDKAESPIYAHPYTSWRSSR